MLRMTCFKVLWAICIFLILSAQRRKENDIPNARAVGEQHDQSIDSNATATRWGHAHLECSNVVGIKEHGLFISGLLGRHLGCKTSGLILWVVELRESICNFSAGDKKLKPLCRARP